MVKIYKWKVQGAPTRRYRSFEHRGWPQAMYNDGSGNMLASIACDDDYTPERAKSGRHAPLKVRITNWNCDPKFGSFQWLTAKGEFATLDEAKAHLDVLIEKFPHFLKGAKK